MRPPLFDHERLDVYQVAREFKRQLRELLPTIPRGNAQLVDQLKRAARSITSNIAEGSGKWSVPDKVHYYHIARGSATELPTAPRSWTNVWTTASWPRSV